MYISRLSCEQFRVILTLFIDIALIINLSYIIVLHRICDKNISKLDPDNSEAAD